MAALIFTKLNMHSETDFAYADLFTKHAEKLAVDFYSGYDSTSVPLLGAS